MIGMLVWPISSSIRSSVRCARLSADVKATSKLKPLRLELAAGRARLRDALLGQVDVAPAGEQVLQVPLALAVAHEHEKAFVICIVQILQPKHVGIE